jgi:hypothetical protein
MIPINENIEVALTNIPGVKRIEVDRNILTRMTIICITISDKDADEPVRKTLEEFMPVNVAYDLFVLLEE